MDRDTAKRFVTASIPVSQRNLPSTSAAATAQSQARKAVEDHQLDRVGMPNRFRFVSEKGEKLEEEFKESNTVYQEEEDGLSAEDSGRSEQEAEAEDGERNRDDADAFLDGLESEMLRSEAKGVVRTENIISNGQDDMRKRKRAEDYTGMYPSGKDYCRLKILSLNTSNYMYFSITQLFKLEQMFAIIIQPSPIYVQSISTCY